MRTFLLSCFAGWSTSASSMATATHRASRIVSLGMLAGPHFGNYEAGFQFGKLGYDLVEKHGLHRYQARVYLRFGNCVMPWRQHVKTGRELVRRAFDAANRIGDLTFAAYSCHHLNTNLLAAGDPLAEVQREAETGLEFAEKVRFGRVIDQITTQLALVRTLRGLTTKFGSFNDGHFDELQFERQFFRERYFGDAGMLVLDPEVTGAFLCGRLRLRDPGVVECRTAPLDIALLL